MGCIFSRHILLLTFHTAVGNEVNASILLVDTKSFNSSVLPILAFGPGRNCVVPFMGGSNLFHATGSFVAKKKKINFVNLRCGTHFPPWEARLPETLRLFFYMSV